MGSPRTATKSSPRSPQLEKAHAQQRKPNAAKNKINLKNKLINFKKKEAYHSGFWKPPCIALGMVIFSLKVIKAVTKICKALTACQALFLVL